MWVSQTYLENAIGVAELAALGLSSEPLLAQFELSARSTVAAVLQYAGYPLPDADLTGLDDVSAAFLRKCVAAIVLRDAYGLRKGIALSREASDAISQGFTMLDAVYAKKLPIPGMEPDAHKGLGGSKFSPTSTHPQRFNLRGSSL